MNIPTSLRQSIDRCAESKGATIVEFLQRGASGKPLFEVFVDNEEGVTLDFCRALSREIQTLLDEEFAERDYKLIVSSPGIDRPLKYPWQYRKHIGRKLAISVKPDGESEKLEGALQSADESGIVLRPDSSGGEEQHFPYGQIEEARVKPPW